jgi:hypothetical protein
MAVDDGPFQDIIEVGWGGEIGDTGWLLSNFGFENPAIAFTGGEFDWAVQLRLESFNIGERADPRIGSFAQRTVNFGAKRRLNISASIIDGSGYDSGGFGPDPAFESDVFTILTEQTFYQKSPFGVTGILSPTNVVFNKGPININLGLASYAVPAVRRDPQSVLIVSFSWSPL